MKDCVIKLSIWINSQGILFDVRYICLIYQTRNFWITHWDHIHENWKNENKETFLKSILIIKSNRIHYKEIAKSNHVIISCYILIRNKYFLKDKIYIFCLK